MAISKTQITLEQAEKLFYAVSGITCKNIGLKYAIAKIKSQLNSEMDIIKDLEKPSEKIENYIKEFNELKIKFALTDKDGNPVISPNGRDYTLDPKKRKEFEKEADKLEKKYKKDIKDRLKQLEDSKKLKAKKKVKLDVPTITISDDTEDLMNLPQEKFDILVEMDIIKYK